MNEQHASALALIRELYALNASEVTVTAGDVRVLFARPAEDLAGTVGEELTALRAENEALKIHLRQVEGD